MTWQTPKQTVLKDSYRGFYPSSCSQCLCLSLLLIFIRDKCRKGTFCLFSIIQFSRLSLWNWTKSSADDKFCSTWFIPFTWKGNLATDMYLAQSGGWGHNSSTLCTFKSTTNLNQFISLIEAQANSLGSSAANYILWNTQDNVWACIRSFHGHTFKHSKKLYDTH